MTEQALRRLSKNAEEMSIREVLQLPLNPRLLACAVMDEEVVPGAAIRAIAAAIALEAIERAIKAGTYIDFRTRRAVEAARSYAGGGHSLGELRVAGADAEAARDLVMQLGDHVVSQVAGLGVAVCGADSRTALLEVLADTLELFPPADERHYAKLMTRMLQEAA